jgi:membrane-bound lytic murein transglycosylase MltF
VLLALALAAVLPATAAAQDASAPRFVERHVIDLGAMKERRIVRVLVPYSKTIYFVDKGRQYGTAVQFGLELEKVLNRDRKKQIDHIHIVFVPMPRDRLLGALSEGYGDIVMANLTITEERLKQVDFTDPLYADAEEVLVASAIDRDPDRNVEAGAKYLRHLIDTYIADEGLSPRDRQLFAFAAYNAGPGNLRKFRDRAGTMGLDPNVWFGNVENAASEIVGRETVQYVSNIFKYYVAYSLLVARMGERTDAGGAGQK